MVSGAIDNLFQSGTNSSAPGTNSADVNSPVDSSTPDSGNILDKISDFVPGATGQKIEDFAKDNLGGFFGNKK